MDETAPLLEKSNSQPNSPSLYGLLKKSRNGQVDTTDDLLKLPDYMKCCFISQKLTEKLFPLWKIFLKFYGFKFFAIGFIQIFSSGAKLAMPVFLKFLLIAYSENNRIKIWKNSSVLLGFVLVQSFSDTLFRFLSSKYGIEASSVIANLVYSKIMKASQSTLNQLQSGRIYNFISTDAFRVSSLFENFHLLWKLIFEVLLSFYLIYREIGNSSLPALGVIVLVIPFNKLIVNIIMKRNKLLMDNKDERIQSIFQLIHNIRQIKFNVLEKFFVKKICHFRRLELKYLKWIKYLDGFCVFLWATTPLIISVLTFVMYSLLGNKLTATKIFTCLALFNVLIFPLNALPWILNGLIESVISLKRVQTFLVVPEIESSRDDWGPKETVVEFQNCHFGHGLEDVSFVVKKGNFVCVSGKVGSGKTTLLNAILQETSVSRGFHRCFNRDWMVGVSTQSPWIKNGTIRENIILGSPHQKYRYKHILGICQLVDDINTMALGDQTLVGPNGIKLSGGQKTRIGLARLLYQDCDAYVLDDPFAPLNSKVADDIYHNCIPQLIKNNKTVILVTNQAKYLKSADYIYLMEDKTLKTECLVQIGHHEQCVQTEELVSDYIDVTKIIETQANDELKEKGNVGWRIYKTYFSMAGYCLTFWVVIFMVLMQASASASQWWLYFWSQHNVSTNHRDPRNFGENIYLYIYVSIGGFNIIVTLVRAFSFAAFSIQAAKKCHDELLKSISLTNMLFFYKVPIGRIINRFSGDTNIIDDTLPFIMNILAAVLLGLVGILSLQLYGFPWSGLFLVALLPLYVLLQKYYKNSVREIRRISSLTFSCVLEQLDETLSGITVIRGLRNQHNYFRELFFSYFDSHQRAKYCDLIVTIWFSFCLKIIGFFFMCFVIYGNYIIFLRTGFIDCGKLGLVLSNGFVITSALMEFVQMLSETEREMVAVERTSEYMNLPVENSDPIWDEWRASTGSLVFENVSFSYDNGRTFVFRDISFSLKEGDKMGIVGRTGVGKSSIFAALYRLMNIQSGNIFYDGVNISNLNVGCLRRNLTIISQDPLVFNSTVRENLLCTSHLADVEDCHVWDVLQKCHLFDVVTNLGGLDADVSVNKLSFGEKQLFSFARSFFSQSRIFCLDEITAGVDPETEEKLTDVLNELLMNRTAIIITHTSKLLRICNRVFVFEGSSFTEKFN